MGAWGTGILEDDNSIDFIYDLYEVDDTNAEMNEVFAITEGDGYLESIDGNAAVVSAGILAHWHSGYPLDGDAVSGLDDWLVENKQPVSAEMRKRAVTAIRRVMGNNSELSELWADSADYAGWRKEMKEVIVSLEKADQ